MMRMLRIAKFLTSELHDRVKNKQTQNRRVIIIDFSPNDYAQTAIIPNDAHV